MTFEQTERASQQSAPASEANESRSKLSQESFIGQGCEAAAPFNIDMESSRIANMLNSAKNYRDSREVAQELSNDLKKLSPSQRNDLLSNTDVKNAWTQNSKKAILSLSNWNENTSTWNNVSVLSPDQNWDGKHPSNYDSIRLVQPGNTLWGIATDELAHLQKPPGQGAVKEMTSAIADYNRIFNPAKIDVAQVIEFPAEGMPHSRRQLNTGDILIKQWVFEDSDAKDLLLPSGESISFGTDGRFGGVHWYHRGADGRMIASYDGDPAHPPKEGSTPLADGGTLKTYNDGWTLNLPGVTIDMTKHFENHNEKSLDVSVKRATNADEFSVKNG